MTDLQEYWQAIHTSMYPVYVGDNVPSQWLLVPTIECSFLKSIYDIIALGHGPISWTSVNDKERYVVNCGGYTSETMTGSCTYREDGSRTVVEYLSESYGFLTCVKEHFLLRLSRL